MIHFETEPKTGASIKVVGVGGGGGNAVNTMISAGLIGVEFIVCNTDAQALADNRAGVKIQIGERGLGAGADPEVGRAAAVETRERICEQLAGADMVFITAGLGGGTGTGAGPVIADVAKEAGALTVAVVTKPFLFEGTVRERQADMGIGELHDSVDTLITIPNERLLEMASPDMPITSAFRLADEVLLNAVQGIADLITVPGLINLDFADVCTIMNEMGMALMGTGRASGENRAREAAQAAISNPLLEDMSIRGARGVLVNITGGPEMSLREVNETMTLIREEGHESANIIFGTVVQESLDEELRVTVIATGLSDRERQRLPDVPVRGSNVTPLRREAVPVPDVPAPGDLFGAEKEEAGAQAAPDSFGSAFEKELDVPAFLRRASNSR